MDTADLPSAQVPDLRPDHSARRRPRVTDGPAHWEAEVVVSAPGRLHLGFLDPGATLGRRFGSIGMMLEGAATVARLAPAAVQQVDAAPHAQHEVARALRIIAQLQSASGRHEPLAVYLSQALPAHAGLGSGTQLALALGRGFAELHGLQLTTPALAGLLDRGARSGIGIAGFDHGGVLVDGGPRRGADAPPVLARFDFPPEWRVVLVEDPAQCGLHGEGERAGLAGLPGFGQNQAARLCHLVLMLILPSLSERDFMPFARGLNEVQRVLGDYFAPAQGGAYSSPAVGRLMRWITDNHGAAVGQSSWGPTAFAILPTAAEAERVITSARAAGVIEAGIGIRIAAGRNRGAQVDARTALAPETG